MALAVVAINAEGHGIADPEAVASHISDLVARFRLAAAFTPAERSFLAETNPDETNRIQFSWRYEAYWTLLWALGFVAELGPPSAPCDAAIAVGLLRDRGRDQFVAEAHLRPQDELLDEADLVYRYHWAVRDGGLSGVGVAGLHPGVVMERHHTLNWLIGYLDRELDDVTTDT